MWANAQRDGYPAEYRWRRLLNAAKFGWRPLLQCRAVTLPRRETRWNLQVCPKLGNRSQPLVGRRSPLPEHVEEVLLFNKFFWLSICALIAKVLPDKVVRWCQDGVFWRCFASCIFQRAACSTFQTCISKFALGPHHVWKYGRHPKCDGWD